MAEMAENINILLLICTLIWVVSFFTALSIILSASTKNMSLSLLVNWTGVIKFLGKREKTVFYVSFIVWLILSLPSMVFIAETLKYLNNN